MNVSIQRLRERLAQHYDIPLADVKNRIPDFQLDIGDEGVKTDTLEVYRVQYKGQDYYVDSEQHVFTATHMWRGGLLGRPLVKNEA